MGELVQAWSEHPTAAAAGVAPGLISWIDPAHGRPVRVPTEDVAHIEVGATVAVVVGGTVADGSAVTGELEPAREVLAADVVADARALRRWRGPRRPPTTR